MHYHDADIPPPRCRDPRSAAFDLSASHRPTAAGPADAAMRPRSGLRRHGHVPLVRAPPTRMASIKSLGFGSPRVYPGDLLSTFRYEWPADPSSQSGYPIPDRPPASPSCCSRRGHLQRQGSQSSELECRFRAGRSRRRGPASLLEKV